MSAGPTFELIDPVRYIGNFSTGKMGLSVVQVLSSIGAETHLVLGPVAQSEVPESVKVYKVISAHEMYERCVRLFPQMDGAILAAAVSDFTPLSKTEQKMKRSGGSLTIELKATKDIAAALGGMKKNHQWLAGFALETENEKENARKKLRSKNLDLIVLNSLQDKGAGFGHDTNKISIISKTAPEKHFQLKSKLEVAQDIIDYISEMMNTQ